MLRVLPPTSPTPIVPRGTDVPTNALFSQRGSPSGPARSDGLQQLDLKVWIHTVQPTRIVGQRGPSALAGDVHDLTGQGVEHPSTLEQPVDGRRPGGVELTEDDLGVPDQVSELRTSIRPHGPDLSERERRHVQHYTGSPGDGQPGQRGDAAADQHGQRRGVEDLPADHAAGPATG